MNLLYLQKKLLQLKNTTIEITFTTKNFTITPTKMNET